MKVIKSEVDDAYKISFIDLASQINSVAGVINTFLTDSVNELSGEAMSKILDSIESQNEGLKNFSRFIQNFDKSIIRATRSMSSYMSPYSELDDSKKAEVENLIKTLRRENGSLEYQLYHPGVDEEGNPKKINVGALRARISENASEITELSKKYKLLDGLAGEDASDAGIISSYFSSNNLELHSLDSQQFNFN